jgi:hypothetical protein
MEAATSSEMAVHFYQNKRFHTSEYRNLKEQNSTQRLRVKIFMEVL